MRIYFHLIFWISAAWVCYTYVLYPVILLMLRLVIHRPVRKHPIEPYVSIVVPAHNEADVIERKIRNVLSLDYPYDKFEIFVVSDGSTDGTAEIVQSLADGVRVRCLVFRENRGKIAALNASIPGVKGEIVVFSDASALFAANAVRELVANFADPGVGVVSGTYKVLKASEAQLGKAEDFYWKYETFLKVQESALGYLVGGHGQILAIRSHLYPFPAPGVINDDYVIPLRIMHEGHRSVYEPRAVAYEEAEEMGGFKRRIRIMAGNLQQLREMRELLWPSQVLPLFFIVSHKAARLLVPLAMGLLAVTNVFLIREPLYARLILLQAIFYSLAILGGGRMVRPKLLRLPYYFCMINAAAFMAIYHICLGRRRMAWK